MIETRRLINVVIFIQTKVFSCEFCKIFKDSFFKSYSGWTYFGLLTDEREEKGPLPKVIHTYPAMMELSPGIPYLEKI